MNENLRKALILYTTESPEDLMSFVDKLSKPTLSALFVDLLTMYLNDKNSSKLRELVTIYIAGYEPTQEKLGYNGYRLEVDTGTKIYCEVKPQNTDSKKKKLNGGGSFNDYTPERLETDIENNPKVLASGFIHGQLIYVFEFDFMCLKNRLAELLKRKFPDNRRKEGDYLRSASFSIKDYVNCNSLKLLYLRRSFESFSEYFSKNLLEVLKTYAKNRGFHK